MTPIRSLQSRITRLTTQRDEKQREIKRLKARVKELESWTPINLDPDNPLNKDEVYTINPTPFIRLGEWYERRDGSVVPCESNRQKFKDTHPFKSAESDYFSAVTYLGVANINAKFGSPVDWIARVTDPSLGPVRILEINPHLPEGDEARGRLEVRLTAQIALDGLAEKKAQEPTTYKAGDIVVTEKWPEVVKIEGRNGYLASDGGAWKFNGEPCYLYGNTETRFGKIMRYATPSEIASGRVDGTVYYNTNPGGKKLDMSNLTKQSEPATEPKPLPWYRRWFK